MTCIRYLLEYTVSGHWGVWVSPSASGTLTHTDGGVWARRSIRICSGRDEELHCSSFHFQRITGKIFRHFNQSREKWLTLSELVIRMSISTGKMSSSHCLVLFSVVKLIEVIVAATENLPIFICPEFRHDVKDKGQAILQSLFATLAEEMYPTYPLSRLISISLVTSSSITPISIPSSSSSSSESDPTTSISDRRRWEREEDRESPPIPSVGVVLEKID